MQTRIRHRTEAERPKLTRYLTGTAPVSRIANIGDERPSFINSGNGGTFGRMFTVGVHKTF